MKNEPWRGDPSERVKHLERKLSNKKARIRNLESDLAAANERAEKAEKELGVERRSIQNWRDGCRRYEEEYDTLRTENAAMREALEKADKTLLGIADELERKPRECLGIANDGFNQWPIRDEMIDGTKKARKAISDTLARPITPEGDNQ